MWVKGHSGVEGNEKADNEAKKAVRKGRRMHKPDIVTPAGIRQAFPLHPPPPRQLRWPRIAMRGWTYLVTDKGPQRQWLWEMGKTGDPTCVCDGWTAQNAAHLFRCPWIGDGRGRTWEEAEEDAEWCTAAARFIL